MKIGLNIGCGRDYRKSTEEMQWINIDADGDMHPNIIGSVEYMPSHLFMMCDEVVATDILEHIHYSEDNKLRWREVLQRWVNCVKKGGTIRIQVPSLKAIADQYEGGVITEELANRVIFGESSTLLDRHYQLFSKRRLMTTLKDMGLEIVEAYLLHVCVVIVARRS